MTLSRGGGSCRRGLLLTLDIPAAPARQLSSVRTKMARGDGAHCFPEFPFNENPVLVSGQEAKPLRSQGAFSVLMR